jgi:hypothetical protein
MEDHVTQEEDKATAVENIEALFDTIKQYGQTNIDLFRLKAADKFSDIVSSAIAAIIVFVVLFMFFALLNIGIALLLGEVLGKSYYGFFALGGFYLIIGLILQSGRKKWFKDPLVNIMIKKLFK